jgi:preprotein translocase subunit SecA
MLGFLNKIFGSKSERDIKQIQPLVEQIKVEYAKLANISNDDLRNKTLEFKAKIAESLAAIDKEIAGLKAQAEDPELAIHEKTEIYDQVDKLIKERDKEL